MKTSPASFEKFTRLYPLSKTLRFELRPIGSTLKTIETDGFLKQDEKRAEDYKTVKLLIDDFHRRFIEKTLTGIQLDWQQLADAIDISKKNSEKKTDLEKIQGNMRTEIISICTKSPEWKYLFKKELIEELLKIELQKENRSALNTFKKFSTYFLAFQESRRNLYDSEAHSTSIAYRVVNENFPKFLNDCYLFETIQEKCPEVAENAERSAT